MNLEPNKIVQVECTGMGHNGEGVCRYDGLALFVPLVLPGEKVKVKITEVKKRHALGVLVEILEASPQRVLPPCPYFGQCGGCQFQHLPYPDQLIWKKQMVIDAFERIGRFSDVPVKDVIGMNIPWKYRNKMQLPLQNNEKDLKIGCYQRGTHQVVDTPVCLIQSDWNNQLLEKIKKVLKTYEIPIYSEETHEGWVRQVLGRSNQKNEGLCILVATAKELPNHFDDCLEELKSIDGLRGVLLNVNSRRTNTVLGKETFLLWGEDSLVERLGSLDFSLSGTAFFQVNPVQTEILYDQVVEFAGLTGKETVLDAYCGTGTIALYLAPHASKIIGIERHPGAVADAKRNAEQNEVVNCEFFEGDIEQYLADIQKMDLDIVVVDPPRAGCSPETLETLDQTGSKKIVYVSCNPSTLARDAAYLASRGWNLQKIQPVDMFPHTSHVEAVALIERKKP